MLEILKLLTRKIKCEKEKVIFHMGILHYRVCPLTHATTYPSIKKAELPILTKLIELDQNTNQGDPRNYTLVCPLAQVNLWRMKMQEKGK